MSANRLFETIVDTTHALIVVLDAKGRIVLFNKACENLSGYHFEEVRGRLIWDFLLLPEEAAGVRAVFENIRAGQFPIQHKNHWVSKSGELRLIEWSNSAVTDESGRVIQIIGTGIDITQRELTEQALRETQQRQKALLDGIPDAAWLLDAQGRYIEVNKGYLARLEDDSFDPVGKTAFEIHPADFAAAIQEEERRIMATRQPLRVERQRRIKGRERYLDVIKVPVMDTAGNVTGIACLSFDVTQHKQAEQALREIQLRQKALLDSIPDAAWLKDSAGRYVEVNQNWLARHNLERAKIIGKTDLEIFAEQRVREIIAEDRQIMNSRQPFHVERHSLSRGDAIWLDVTKTPVLDEHGNVIGIAGVSRDITRRVLAEQEQLKRDANLREALVREVNHRIKNNLQSVMALLHQHSVSHPEIALIMQKAIARLNAIATVHGLHSGAAAQEVNLCNIVNALATSMWGLHSGTPIEVETAEDFVAAQVANSETVPVALIITELIQNAVKHSPAADPGKPIRIQLARTGPAIRITISNPGAALPAAFDFARGSGLGTGLRLLKSLMPPTGAEICFEAAAQTGITVTLTLSPPVLMATDKPQITDGAFQHG